MIFKYKGTEYRYPAALEDITLQQRIDFHRRYGIPFDKAVTEAQALEDEAARTLELTDLQLSIACQAFAFFTGIPEEEVKENFSLEQVMNVYNVSLAMLLYSEKELEIREEFEFNNEKWVLAPPSLTPTSEMTFNEFLSGKEIVRQLEALGNGRFESLLYLCCIYLRRPDEAFTEELVEARGDRMELFKNLPLDIALSVGFFLSDSMLTFSKVLASSKKVEEEKARI